MRERERERERRRRIRRRRSNSILLFPYCGDMDELFQGVIWGCLARFLIVESFLACFLRKLLCDDLSNCLFENCKHGRHRLLCYHVRTVIFLFKITIRPFFIWLLCFSIYAFFNYARKAEVKNRKQKEKQTKIFFPKYTIF